MTHYTQDCNYWGCKYNTKGNRFAKPFAFSLYVYDLNTNEIIQYFRSASDGSILCWNIEKCNSLIELKEFECYSRPDINTGWYGDFEFLTKEEQIKHCLRNMDYK